MARELAILVTARNMASGVLKDVRGDIKGIQSEARRGAANTARNLGILGVAAGAALATQVHQGIQSLARLETIAAQTNAVIESTGGAANVTADEIRAQADAIERLTGIESEATQEGQNLLLTFTNIRNEAGKDKDIFTQASETLVDMSVALGQDASQSAIQLGKALNDPIRGVTALRRVGVQFTKTQEDQIKNFVESGDIMGAQRLILAELNREFGGSASAFGDTAQGRLQKMQHAWGTLQEQLAMGVLPVLERVGAKLTDLFNDPATGRTVQDIGKAIGEGLEDGIEILQNLPWGAIGDTFSLMGQGARAVLSAFTSLPPWVQTAVLTSWGLNKLTGGALGNIVGALGSGLVKGVLGMNAGVVNINAGTVTGGGGGTVPATGGGGGGGLWTNIKNFGALAAIPLTVVAIGSVVDAVNDAKEQGEDVRRHLDSIDTSTLPGVQARIEAIDAQVEQAGSNIVGEFFGIDDRLRAGFADERAELVAQKATMVRTASEARSFDSAMLGNLRTIAAKRTSFSPTVNVTANLHNTVVVSGQQAMTTLNSLRESVNAGTAFEGFI